LYTLGELEGISRLLHMFNLCLLIFSYQEVGGPKCRSCAALGGLLNRLDWTNLVVKVSRYVGTWNPVPVIHTELIIVSSRPAHILPPRRFKMAKIDHEQ
jgi:hypothetical protein